MIPLVFAGPSLCAVTAELLAGIDLRPPAGKGDVLAAVRSGAKAIGIVDGTFEYGASVWHKEILYAIRQGVAVFGAGSMGALRAAECSAFGMVGIGRVFADYSSGKRRSDADVAMVHAPAALGYKPLTEALVDIDETLARLQSSGGITAELAERLGKVASHLHFKARSWPQIVAAADIGGTGDALAELLRSNRVSIKTEDALALISHMRGLGPTPGVEATTFDFNETLFFQEMLAAAAAKQR